jgi:hypothetical protein
MPTVAMPAIAIYTKLKSDDNADSNHHKTNKQINKIVKNHPTFWELRPLQFNKVLNK